MDVDIAPAIRSDLLSRWNEPHRRHHHQQHLDEVARLVELTLRHHPEPDDRNGIALSDADFAVLGAEPQRYAEYAANVRAEFHEVPDEYFRPARSELLAEFLTRDEIFASEPAQQRWEATARTNLAREIEALTPS